MKKTLQPGCGKKRTMAPRVTILTAATVRAGELHLTQSCTVMASLITRHGLCPLAEREFRPFYTLATSIISQQLSTKAADTIAGRVAALVPGFAPAGFMTVSPDSLRQAGLSTAKVRYLIELSLRVCDGRLDFDTLWLRSDADVISALTEVPGIGPWTAEMFLIFGLKRPDVLALGDAGLQRAARQLFGAQAKLQRLGRAWAPYRSIASWYLWQHLDAG
jgi:DNA-3-methyladenine glycosylase II